MRKEEQTFNVVEGLDGVIREVKQHEMIVLRAKVVPVKTVQNGKTFTFFYRQVED